MPSRAQSGESVPGTVDEALDFIHGLVRFGSMPGLVRIQRLLALLGNPQRGIRTIHVAGTNGKGSVTAIMASVLGAAGHRTGRYISPYIDQFAERIATNGRPIAGEDILLGIREMAPLLRQMLDEGYEHPTEFEVVTALGFWEFWRRRVDVVALEVGLGGRMDATNVITSEDLVAAVITNIGRDHVEQLGPTLADIAREKAGIIKPGRPVITAANQPGPRAVIMGRCREMGAPLAQFGREFSARGTAACLSAQAFNYEDERGELTRLIMPLVGRHQVVNAACALAALRRADERGLAVREDAIRTGLRATAWPARFELCHTSPPVIVDSAHNSEGVATLVDTVKELIGERVILVAGMLGDKPLGDMVLRLSEIAAHAVVTTVPSPRTVAPAALAMQFLGRGVPVTVEPDVPTAVAEALTLSEGRRAVVCCGSSYLAGPVRREFLSRR